MSACSCERVHVHLRHLPNLFVEGHLREQGFNARFDGGKIGLSKRTPCQHWHQEESEGFEVGKHIIRSVLSLLSLLSLMMNSGNVRIQIQ